MKISVFIPAVLFMLCGLCSKAQQSTPTATMKPVASTAKLSYKLIELPDKTFGYDVYSDKHLLVHQPSIPGFPGNSGFKTRSAAEKVAQLVVNKIKKGEMPPTVSADELKALHAI